MILLLCLCTFLSSQTVQAERVYLDVTASDVRKVIVAVPDFTPSSGQRPDGNDKAMASLLANALELHGFIDIIDSSRYGGNKDTNWKALNVDYVILGRYTLTKKGLSIEGRLQNVEENKIESGRRYRGTTAQQDEMVLRLADGLIEEFTGEKGISRTSLAYISDASGKKEVYVSDILGRTQRQITMHRHLCVSPRFTPNGTHLAYSTYHRGNQDLYYTDLSQNKKTRALSRRKGMNLAPAFSPDGRNMVATLSKDGTPDLYLMDLEGKILQRLTSRTGINVSPSYSPDGKSLTFVSDRSGRPQVYVMELNSKKVRRLTFNRSENSEPVWSPKGDQIAFTGLLDGHYQLFTMDINGNNEKQISSGWGDFESPSWSPDGKHLALTRKRNGQSELCVVGKNGKNMRVLYKLKGNQSYPQWSSRPK